MENNSSYRDLRIKNFNKICSNFDHVKISELISYSKINDYLFSELVDVSKEFLEISKSYDFLNMTPNGRLMPKKENEDVFNKFLEIYRDIICSLNIQDHIKKWVIPSIRYKIDSSILINKNRSSRSELPHSDAWAGWGEEAILIQIPILGDTKNNRVNFYSLPLKFERSWMRMIDFDKAQHMADQCQKIDSPYEKGYIYICDISVIHATCRNSNAKPRMSIDIPIITNEDSKFDKKFENDVVSNEIFYDLGSKYKLECINKINEVSKTQYKIIRI